MIRHPGCKVISVESRKGGVGKSTVCLMIADVICNPGKGTKSKQKTILIDLDICGTSLKYLESSGAFNHIEFADCNLVDLFKDFMAGKEIPGIRWDFKKKDILLIPSKIEITSDKNNFYPPQVLFDELHATWFMEFLNQLMVSFLSQCGQEHELVFILDNPPGYTELVPVVQEMLVELGPGAGKTLFVTSLDYMDLEASFAAMKDLFLKYSETYNAARVYHQLESIGDNRGPVDRNNINRPFFDKLLNQDLHPDNFYMQANHFLNYEDRYLKEPGNFMDIIVNRVPAIFMEKDFFKEKLDQETIEKLLAGFENDFPGIVNRLLENRIKYNERLIYLHTLLNLKSRQVVFDG